MIRCDLNCDMGEGMGNDELLLPYITSANIACGYHAGNIDTMKRLVDLCTKFKVLIGAHPAYPDRKNFGRIDLVGASLKAEDIRAIMNDQLALLNTVCVEAGTRMHHVKPHGALYNRACWDEEVAAVICSGIEEFNSSLILYGMSNSMMKKQAANNDIVFWNEGFADRTYQDDGSLTPRSLPGSLLSDVDSCKQQVVRMIIDKQVTTITGRTIPIEVDTVCIHGDGEHAVEFAHAIQGVCSISTFD